MLDVQKTVRDTEAEIHNFEGQIAALQKKLSEKRDLLIHLKAVINDVEGRTGGNPHPPFKNWKNICNEKGWSVGGDSAHRVVRRMDPKLHTSIPHKCVYEGRTYP